jgi:inorganic pyrophosphatase
MNPYEDLPPFDPDDGTLNAIVETPKGSRSKIDYEPKKKLFVLKRVLPLGQVFPFDFGYIPQTLGEDGDPLDVLILMDEPAVPGCLVPSRLVGAIEAEQTEAGGTLRNDRLIAVAEASQAYEEIASLDDVPAVLVKQIEFFFVAFNEVRGKRFDSLGRSGPERARQLVAEGVARCKGGR